MIHLVFLLCFFLMNPCSLAADTIFGNQTIVSFGGNFELEFFSSGNSSKHYMGINKKVNKQTVVWVGVADRVTPIFDKNYAHLTIVDGNLVLLKESNSHIWSTGVKTPNNSSVVTVVLKDGNLVLKNGSGSNPSNCSQPYLWESLDSPGDTWLPGGKMAYNKITQTKQLLTSWKNLDDSVTCLFSLELGPNGIQCTIRLNYICNFNYVNNSD